jgi:hypothetical protein
VTAVSYRPVRAVLVALAIAAALLSAGLVVTTTEAKAARGMELAIQDDSIFVRGNSRWKGDKPFKYARALGVTRIRVNLLWAYTMYSKQYRARRKPKVVNYQFSQIDSLIDRAAKNGIRVHLSLSGPAPRWANSRKKNPEKGAWYKPSTREYGKWASVVAEHFAGRVDRYSIWNEPNWKTWLGPLKAAPAIYRSLYVRGYGAIKKADPKAKVLIGETSPYERRGLSTAPLAFLRKVACVDKRYKRKRSCPKLKADGYAHHPYDFLHAPNFKYPGSDNVTIGTLSRLTKTLDRLRRSGALRAPRGARMPVYLTEYGYFASGKRALKSKQRSRYLQRAYSIALKNGRVRSQLQYLLAVLPRGSTSTFNTGLVTQRGKRLSQYKALQRWYRKSRGKVKRPGRAITVPPAKPNPSVG